MAEQQRVAIYDLDGKLIGAGFVTNMLIDGETVTVTVAPRVGASNFGYAMGEEVTHTLIEKWGTRSSADWSIKIGDDDA